MGTNSTKKFLKNVNGYSTEEFGLTTSAGAADADRIPVLNQEGILDDSIIGASATSVPGKIAKQNAEGHIDPAILNATQASAGPSDAGKIAQLSASGRLDMSVMPTGVGQDSAAIVASEAISSGDFVNIWNDNGQSRIRKADASQKGKEAHGFVLQGGAAEGDPLTVLFEGSNTAIATPLAAGQVYLSTTPGLATETPPTGANQVQQVIGFAYGSAINFQSRAPIVLA